MMVQRIVEAYEKYEKTRGGQEEPRRNNGSERAGYGGKGRK
jgi:hypothetical protein